MKFSKVVSRLVPHLIISLTVLLLIVPIEARPNKNAYKYPPLGRLVDAGGHRLHLYCTGTGRPTVVIENGTGDFSFDWSLVQPSVAQLAKVCTYDRAGYAWSEPGPKPRTFQQLTMELHTALHNAGVKGPYILVGQSYGGFVVRAFTRYYPKEVAGMVLVDAVNEDSRVHINNKAVRIREMAQGRSFPPPQVSKLPKAQKQSSLPSASPADPTETKIEAPLDKLPLAIQQIRLWAQSQPIYDDARSAELDWSPEELAQMYANRGKPEYMLGDIPLIVLTRGSGGYSDEIDVSAQQLEEERLRLQTELTHLSRNSKQVIAKNSGHNIHLEDPGLVIDAIHQVVNAVRGDKRLAR